LGDATVQKDHVGIFGLDLVELAPDQAVIVEVLPAGHGHFRAGGEKHLRVSPLPGGQKIAAVDQRRCQMAMIDARTEPGLPA
jgi:hypothetical protein